MGKEKSSCPVCSTCGKLATHAVRDVTATPDFMSEITRYAPRGSVRYGCDDHPEESMTHEIPMQDVLMEEYRKYDPCG